LVRHSSLDPGKPVTELGVPRDTYYGRSQDHDDTQVDMVTSLYRNRVNENITFHNDTRLAIYSRDIAASVPNCGTIFDATPSNCSRDFLNGLNPQIAYGGGNPTYTQDAWSVQNVSSVVAKFNTAHLKHEAVFGVDLSYQDDERYNYTISGKTAPGIRNPELLYNAPYTVGPNASGNRYGQGTNAGVFASDRVWFTPEISVLAGIRWDYFKSEFYQPNTVPLVDRESTVDVFTPKASLIWEPTRNQTYYASYAESAVPIGQFVTNVLAPIGSDPLQDQVEESESYELGAKYSLLGGKLGLSGAIFQVTKGNSVVTDPATGLAVFTGEEQRVRGVEIGVTGELTPAWSVFAGYAYLDTEILDSATAANVGNKIGGVPEHSGSLWTTYNLSKHIISGPGRWTIGGGATFSDEMYTLNNSANTYVLPFQYTLDAMVSYEVSGWRAALNGYNLTDELNYDASFNQRAVPSAGRSFVVTVGKKF
jgi:catecholate siderophore receptor